MSEMTVQEAREFKDALPPHGQTLTFETTQAQKNFYAKWREADRIIEAERVKTALADLRAEFPGRFETARYPISRLLPYCSHTFRKDKSNCLMCDAPYGAPRGNVDPVTRLYIDPRTPVPCPAPLCRWVATPEPLPSYGVYFQINAHLENFHPLYSWFKNLRKPKQVNK